MLRNKRWNNAGIGILHALCTDISFPLCHRVAWGQTLQPADLLTASRLLKVSCLLHDRFRIGLAGRVHDRLARSFNQLAADIGEHQLRANIMAFWNLLDDCFGVQCVADGTKATHLKPGFVNPLADVFAKHENFWDGAAFVFPKDLRKKLSHFSLHDPGTKGLVVANQGPSGTILSAMIKVHLDHGKQTKKLRPFSPKY